MNARAACRSLAGAFELPSHDLGVSVELTGASVDTPVRSSEGDVILQSDPEERTAEICRGRLAMDLVGTSGANVVGTARSLLQTDSPTCPGRTMPSSHPDATTHPHLVRVE